MQKPLSSTFLILPLLTLLFSGLLTSPSWAAQESPSQKLHKNPLTETVTFLSRNLTIDRIYKSMQGPADSQSISLTNDNPPELLWITNYHVAVMEPDGETPALQEFMCHNNLDFNPGQHGQMMGWSHMATGRMFTLSQGQFVITFPAGFGIPVMSDEPLDLTTQVLNHNVRDAAFQVRHKVTIRYLRDRDAAVPMTPLFTVGVYSLALLKGDQPYFGVEHPDASKHGPGCLIGANASGHTYSDPQGRTFTGHWVVPPGRQVNRTLVTKMLNLPFDTTIQAIAAHLHPFAESLELRDLTADRAVFISRAENFPDRIGLAKVEAFSSVEGIPVFKGHEYELVSVYNNTSGVDQDSMAVMLLYLRDRDVRVLEPAAIPLPQSGQSAP